MKINMEISKESLLQYSLVVDLYNKIKNTEKRIETTEEFKILPYVLQKIFIQEHGLYI